MATPFWRRKWDRVIHQEVWFCGIFGFLQKECAHHKFAGSKPRHLKNTLEILVTM